MLVISNIKEILMIIKDGNQIKEMFEGIYEHEDSSSQRIYFNLYFPNTASLKQVFATLYWCKGYDEFDECGEEDGMTIAGFCKYEHKDMLIAELVSCSGGIVRNEDGSW